MSSSSRSTITTSNVDWLSKLAGWLGCPTCGEPLRVEGSLVLGCSNRHRFDANRRGYLSVRDASSGIVGDPASLLDRRARFLATGNYQPIADAVRSAAAHVQGTSAQFSILDSGCGTGYYLEWLLAGLPGDLSGLAVDVSLAAVQRAVAATGVPGLVADVWQPSPVLTSRADMVLCVFAPRNAEEFHRVLRPTGALIVVTPAPTHLTELRAAGLAIGMQENKSEKLDAQLLSRFALESRAPVNYTMELDASSAADLAGMGPSGHHELSARLPTTDVTVSVHVSVYRRLATTHGL